MKLNILGASGSGVTTLGKALAERWNVDYFDSDAFFWEQTSNPFSVRKDPKLRDETLLRNLNHKEQWILGGSVIQWDKEIHKHFDAIVFLYIPQAIRLERIKVRELERFGEAIETDPIRRSIFEKFFIWAKDYDEDTGIANRTLKAHRIWLKAQKAPIIELMGDLSVAQRIKRIEDVLQFR